jgi:metal-responsive CopG/Arc/MetJ family transcriptional regulator
MMAKTEKSQTYRDVIDALTTHSITLPAKLLEKMDAAINDNRKLGYATREKFVEDAVTAMLQKLADNQAKLNKSL